MANAGGMAVQRAVAEMEAGDRRAVDRELRTHGTSPAAISNTLDIKDWTGTIGVPIPSTEAAIPWIMPAVKLPSARWTRSASAVRRS